MPTKVASCARAIADIISGFVKCMLAKAEQKLRQMAGQEDDEDGPQQDPAAAQAAKRRNIEKPVASL